MKLGFKIFVSRKHQVAAEREGRLISSVAIQTNDAGWLLLRFKYTR